MLGPPGRELIEGRFGPLGSGAGKLSINGAEYDLAGLLAQLGIGFDDTKPIDALVLATGRYLIRYLDAQDQRIVACEFDGNFQFLGETRAHVSEWTGQEADDEYYGGH